MTERNLPGRTYLESGSPVVVVTQWGLDPRLPAPGWLHWHEPPRSAPRNILIRRAGGQLTVRPFRGLRKTGRDTAGHPA